MTAKDLSSLGHAEASFSPVHGTGCHLPPQEKKSRCSDQDRCKCAGEQVQLSPPVTLTGDALPLLSGNQPEFLHQSGFRKLPGASPDKSAFSIEKQRRGESTLVER